MYQLAILIILPLVVCMSNPWKEESLLLHQYGGHRSSLYGNKVIEFGGMIEDVNQASPLLRFKQFFNTFREYSINTDQWKYIQFSNPPSARAVHGQAIVNTDIHIVGGFAGFLSVYSDHHICNLQSHTCTNSIAPFGKRVGIAVAAVGTSLYLFGGNTIDLTKPNPVIVYGDTWKYTASTGWTLLNTTGQIPQKRTNAQVFVRDKDFCIFSGEDNASGPLRYLNMTIYCLNTHTGTWKIEQSKNEPRTFAFAACAYSDNTDSIICQGGDYGSCARDLITSKTTLYDFNTHKWYEGIIPDYLAGPASKRATLTIHKKEGIHTGGYAPSIDVSSDVLCDMVQTYINNTYVYKINNVYNNLLN